MVLNKNEAEIERLMREGQVAAKRGDKAMARTLLTQLLEHEPNNEQAWMWLSGAVTDLTEQQTCLENVLIINPNNAQARKGLEYIRARSGRSASAAFERFSGPLSVTDIPDESPATSDASATSTQNRLASSPTSESETPAMPTQMASQADVEHDRATDGDGNSSLDPATPIIPSQLDASESVQALPIERSISEEDIASIDGITPFQAPDDLVVPIFASSLPAEGTPPETSMAVPDWVRNLPKQDATQSIEAPQDPQISHEIAEASPITNPSANDAALPQGQIAPGLEVDLSAWLEDLASSASPNGTEQSHVEGATELLDAPGTEQLHAGQATEQLGAPGTEQLAPFGPALSGPFPSGPFSGPSPADFPPIGPYTANELPMPDDLPGAHDSAEPDRPWYLQTSDDSSASIGEAVPMGHYTDTGGEVQASSNAAPIATLECPNCQHRVPETSLACPNCRYGFFVHCPHCHELVDTSTAGPNIIEPCPYCGIDIDKMELGLSATGDTSPKLSAPKETEKSWVGEGLIRPAQRSGILLSFSWLVDLVWLMIIAMMVWALTQLPTWWHLTNLYK